MNRLGLCDRPLLVLALGLTGLGIVMVYSASSIMASKEYADGFYFLKKQSLYAGLGLMMMVLFAHIDYQIWRRLAVFGLFVSAALLLMVFIPGVGSKAGGATRWLHLGPLTLQPSEVAKLGLVVYLAFSLAKKKEKLKTFKFGLIPYILVLAVLLGIVLAQPDFGSAVIMGAVACCMLLVAGTRWVHLFSLVLLAMPFVYFLVVRVDYRMKRVAAFLNPWADPHDSGFQIIQSWTAVGTGSWFGRGLGGSKQKLFFLPEAHTDFIFSVIGEELGFIGVAVVITMFLLLILRGMRIALHAPDDFGRNLAFGLTVLLGLEVVINLAVVLGMLPTKGLALPFLSYGGTSILCTLIAVGMLLSVSRSSLEVTR